jgi:recombination protein RecT
MNNQITVVQRVDAFVGDVLTKDRREMLLASLPAHVKPERFERNLVIAVQNHPKLLGCDAQAVFNEVAKCAALGLYLDPQLGEAYLITGWSGALKCEVPQLRLGYRGLIKLSRQSGEIHSAYAHEVCENDILEISLGSEKTLIHRPDYKRDRGPVVLYYAVVKYRDGVVDFEPMSLEDVHQIRDRSDGYRAWMEKKIKSTPWATDEGEMAKKTVLRRLMKRLPQSPEIGDALRIEDDDFREERPVDPPSLRAKLATNAISGRSGFSHASVMRQTAPLNETLEGDDLPDQLRGVDMAVDAPSSEPEPSQPKPAAPENVSHERGILEMSADQRRAWAESFRAQIMAKAKTSIVMMEMWTDAFDSHLKPMSELDPLLATSVEEWFGKRLKRFRETEQAQSIADR